MDAHATADVPARVIVKKVIRADRERVFDAWTKPELMKQWFVGSEGFANAKVDLRPGGAYSNEMVITGKKTCGGHPAGNYMHEGVYLEVVRPARLVFTWNSPAVQNTTVTVELRDVDGGTEVTITHDLNLPSDCAGHREGWTFALEGLAALFA